MRFARLGVLNAFFELGHFQILMGLLGHNPTVSLGRSVYIYIFKKENVENTENQSKEIKLKHHLNTKMAEPVRLFSINLIIRSEVD